MTSDSPVADCGDYLRAQKTVKKATLNSLALISRLMASMHTS
jgi:hypothetical protein